MRDRSNSGGVVIAVGLLLIVLLSIGGVAGYLIVSGRQTALIMQAERAQLAEAQALMLAERARVQAQGAAAAGTASATRPSTTCSAIRP